MFRIVLPGSHYQKVCRANRMNFIQKIKRKLFLPREVIEGYENPELVETIFLKTVNYKPDGQWPLVAGVGTVLDFGGGAGLHYKVARQQSPDIRWAVVETPAMVRRANELATDRLMFFERIEEAADWLGNVDLVHSNGAIQYVPDAFGSIQTLCAVRPAKLVWHRVPISDDGPRREVQTSYLSDNGPGQLSSSAEKLVRYERTWISERAFIEAHENYKIAERGPDPGEHGTQQFKFLPC
ncbi:hypothetical protein I3J27_38670 [Bradyrhizobium xenonodulans]|uniref:Methyltransferase, TIGR04325 family n=1 Tax=Bradyrhizobium xenonodulans TaxID=2736875 RepID=A0ABY7MPD3_9BRAD|nr:hypothetical protein [Bradyrhizobium xenonodulans]WBL78790.1 hypothetical protein I3J27_38670 [Bradyrhizobium xenonodulans]